MRDAGSRLLLAAIARLPQAALSRLAGRIADLRLPRRIRKPLLGAFARAVGIDLSEIERPLDAYETFDAFFVRRLKPGARAWPADPATIASPTDGILGASGRIEDGTLVQAKGLRYTTAELLADAEEAARFSGGSFLTIYLSPRHYHRIHAPASGSVVYARRIPGRLLPVNAPAVRHVPGLFARNERVVCVMDGPDSRIAVVAVGALNVGRISIALDGIREKEREGPHSVRRVGEDRGGYDPPRGVRRGDEIMAFHLGSTVVLLLGSAAPALRTNLDPGGEIRLGDALTTDRPE